MASKRAPPVEHQFKPGVRPKGRPKGSKNKPTKMRTPALDETTKVAIDGVMRRMSRREAIVRFAETRAFKTMNDKLMGFLARRKQKLAEGEKALDYHRVNVAYAPRISFRFNNIEAAVVRLGLGKLIFCDHPAQRVGLVPESVSEALAKFEERCFTRDEQKLVLSFTLTPKKVDWPEWWEPGLCDRKVRVPARFFKEEDAEWERALTQPPPAPPPPPRPIDIDAEIEKERTAWLCKNTGKPQYPPCSTCVRVKKKVVEECFNRRVHDDE